MPHMGEYTGVLDDEVTSAKITDDEIVNADVATSAAIAYSKLATDPRICRIKTGTYTGDGTTSQAITGVGFQPKMLWIYEHHTVEATNPATVFMHDLFVEAGVYVFAGGNWYTRDDKILSLEPDGFTVSDEAGDAPPNKLNAVYDYLALG